MLSGRRFQLYWKPRHWVISSRSEMAIMANGLPRRRSRSNTDPLSLCYSLACARAYATRIGYFSHRNICVTVQPPSCAIITLNLNAHTDTMISLPGQRAWPVRNLRFFSVVLRARTLCASLHAHPYLLRQSTLIRHNQIRGDNVESASRRAAANCLLARGLADVRNIDGNSRFTLNLARARAIIRNSRFLLTTHALVIRSMHQRMRNDTWTAALNCSQSRRAPRGVLSRFESVYHGLSLSLSAVLK